MADGGYVMTNDMQDANERCARETVKEIAELPSYDSHTQITIEFESGKRLELHAEGIVFAEVFDADAT